MARKSRKENTEGVLPDYDPPFVSVAAYVRLSVEDRTNKGSSIATQQQIISAFVDESPELRIYDTYIDSGVSGVTFERPSFQRMLHDATAGKIQCVVVKDLSRLGRNAIDTGYYAENVFPQLGIRLISITDNYDSSAYNDGIRLPMINLINEAYAFDISKKTKSQVKVAMAAGIYVGGRPPYGYMRSPNDRHKLIVDESAAVVVRQIYEWAERGTSISNIARKLNEAKMPSPGHYKRGTDSKNLGRWCVTTIDKMLANAVYLGHMVQGKTKTISLNRKKVPAEEWVHVNDAHEAIVSAEVFQAVQSMRQKSREHVKSIPVTPYTANIFVSKTYCAHCGGRLERTRNHARYVFRCTASRTAPNSCVGNWISEDAVKLAVSEQLFQLRDELLKRFSTSSKRTNPLPELRFIGLETSRLERLTRSLYESLVTGLVDKAEYMRLKSGYQTKLDEYQRRGVKLQQELKDEERASMMAQEAVDALAVFCDTKMLDKAIIERFVDRVEISNDGHVHVVWERDSII
jgi:DNA invertase Pin-like site-specific DNA recombinase